MRARPLPRRVWDTWLRVWRALPVRVFLLTRLPPIVVGYLAVLSIGFPAPVPFRLAESELGNLMARWDTGWYMGLALGGYDNENSSAQ